MLCGTIKVSTICSASFQAPQQKQTTSAKHCLTPLEEIWVGCFLIPHTPGSIGVQQSVLYQFPPSLPHNARVGFKFPGIALRPERLDGSQLAERPIRPSGWEPHLYNNTP